LIGYLEARENGEWPQACSYLVKSLRKFYAQAANAKQGGGCPGFVRRTTQQLPESKRSSLADVEIEYVRIKGGSGRVVYLDSSGTRSRKLAQREAGEWKLGSILVQLLKKGASSQ